MLKVVEQSWSKLGEFGTNFRKPYPTALCLFLGGVIIWFKWCSIPGVGEKLVTSRIFRTFGGSLFGSFDPGFHRFSLCSFPPSVPSTPGERPREGLRRVSSRTDPTAERSPAGERSAPIDRQGSQPPGLHLEGRRAPGERLREGLRKASLRTDPDRRERQGSHRTGSPAE